MNIFSFFAQTATLDNIFFDRLYGGTSEAVQNYYGVGLRKRLSLMF